MRLLPPSLSILFTLLIVSGLAAQHYTFKYRYFSVEDGLASRFLTNVVQDNQGFIWLGSDFGVSRFDGRNFKNFNANNSGLRSESRIYLAKDSNGRIWANNTNGAVDIIDPFKERIVKLEDLYPRFAKQPVKILQNTHEGEVWGIFGQDSLLHYDSSLHTFGIAPDFSNGDQQADPVPSFSNSLYYAVENHLGEYDLRGKLLKDYPDVGHYSASYRLDSSILFLSYSHVVNNHLEVEPKVWKLNNGGRPELLKLTHGNMPFTVKLRDSNFWSVSINEDSQGRIWLLLQDRLFVFGKDGKLLAEAPSFKDFDVQINSKSIFFGRQGEVWVSGRMGIYVFELKKNDFTSLLHNETGVNISVRGITELTDGSLLACTYNGIYQIDPKTNASKKISDDIHYGVMQTKDRSIWFGQHFEEVIRTTMEKWNEKQYFHTANMLKGEGLLRPFEDPYTGDIYIGSRSHGLFIFDQEKQVFQAYQRLNGFSELAKLELTYLYPKQDYIMLATNAGLYKMDREKGIIERFNNFPENYIYHFSEDENGVFWLATRGGGIIRWNSKTGLTRQFTTPDGLSNSIIYAVMDDGLGYLWLPSNYGLMRFNKKTGFVSNFLTPDGITHEEFNNTSFCRGSDGTFYLGGLDGITAFNPAEIKTNQFSAPMMVTEYQVLHGGQLEDRTSAYKEANKIVIQPEEKFFTLDFALLDFCAKKHFYAWKLEGLDNEWTFQEDNTIRFNALPHGNFKLRIRGQGAGNYWSENELVIPVSVIQPFFKTWKFALLCIIGFSLLTFFSVRWRIRWLRREKRRLALLVEERTKELVKKNTELSASQSAKDRMYSIIAHDLRSPLVTLGGLARKVAFLIRQNRLEEVYQLGETVENSVVNVRNLLDNLLKWSMIQGGRFPHSPEPLLAGELVTEVVGLYKNVAEAKGVELASEIVCNPVIIADKNSVQTVVRNVVDNAIKFTPENGRVNISVYAENGFGVIEVCDTGVGIYPEMLAHIFDLKNAFGEQGTNGEKGNGIGLVLCHELVEINQGTINVENNTSGGATFSIRLHLSEQPPI
ncbi:MAG: hypothetical protein GC192_15145 [Bacteroidetes bacterium]|nr:hypothetical protein [Bacteroidota bacterium]